MGEIAGGGQRHERGAPGGVAGDLEAAVAADEGFLEDEERGVAGGGAQHEQGVSAGADVAVVGEGEEGGAAEAEGHPDPGLPGGAFGEDGPGQHGGEDRAGVDQQVGGAGVDGALAGVEEELVAGHAGEGAGGQAR